MNKYMKQIIALFFFIVISVTASAQINLSDSTVQVIGYWSKNEKQSYRISSEKQKIQGNDTTTTEKYNYDVDVTILDSTATSYLIEWKYKKFNVEKGSDIMKKIFDISPEMKVVIRTNENGEFQEVVNWKEVKTVIEEAMSKLRKEMKDYPTILKLLKQVEETYSSKDAIERTTIDEIKQFYSFYGVKYESGKTIEGKIKVPTRFGNELLDSEISTYLDEINTADNNYIVRTSQVVDSTQLQNAAYGFMCNIAKTMGVPPPNKETLNGITNETETASRIHNSGWVIYSVETKVVSLEKTTSIEERIIEIQ